MCGMLFDSVSVGRVLFNKGYIDLNQTALAMRALGLHPTHKDLKVWARERGPSECERERERAPQAMLCGAHTAAVPMRMRADRMHPWPRGSLLSADYCVRALDCVAVQCA